ncbi:flagellar basal body P-ring protein FlgI [Desulfosediminicola flagellatus]|uniref:flagellar basal body P-ring protein FlgI n=1 Tax=Desulfosediminicola flagellatus TaxID=2569541 RepID=UPI0010AD385C|nr:flagellar basal body P-ring protein FlgI [Desulfosediminicola flagellatus]
MIRIIFTILAVIAFIFPGGTACDVSAARIKDIASLQGVRNNQLLGYGLVTGLNGTGDDMKKSGYTLQAVYNMIARNGITLDPDNIEDIKVNNIAAVMVTAKLPPFARPGSTVDVHVSSIGDADSLAGGTLLMTPLRGANNKVYAVAQGPLTIGSFSFGGKAATVQQNHPTAGHISSGAIVEGTVPVVLGKDGQLFYQLNNADFTTATNMAKAINSSYEEEIAHPLDSGTVKVMIPASYQDTKVEFISAVERLQVDPDSNARVVLNERTGTIVMGKDVKLSTVAVSHGNLSLIIREDSEVVQPNPLAEGDTVTVPRTQITVTEDQGQLIVLDMDKDEVTIGEIATALNAIGATPRDLIAIFQAIKASGSMHGELIIL